MLILIATHLSFEDTGPDAAVAKSSTNGLGGTEFASWYQLHPEQEYKSPMYGHYTLFSIINNLENLLTHCPRQIAQTA